MAEGLFWIFISFFAVLGVLELFKMLEAFICRKETKNNMLLIPVGDDSDLGAECRIHTVMAGFSDTLSLQGRVFIVDVGMGEKNRDVCRRLCNLYGLETVKPDELSSVVGSVCCKKE